MSLNNNGAPVAQHAAAEPETKPTKAIVGAVYSGAVAFLGALGIAMTDGVVNGLEWVTIASATVIAVGGAAGLIYYVPNNPKHHA